LVLFARRCAAVAALWRARVLSFRDTIELRRDPATAGRSRVSLYQPVCMTATKFLLTD
jgi:hypothetical protein